MRKFPFLPIGLLLLISCSTSEDTGNLLVSGISDPVEVIRDPWGINHIYAQNQHDLFFAQGYCAAKDRLFQFEIWRRQATGTVAELLGPREVKRDHGTRLFKFRKDMEIEMNHYHPDGVEIITAYVNGVNAYIDEIMKTPENLPLPFQLLGTIPQKWTPEVVISRHQGLLGNIGEELAIGRAIALIGAEKIKKIEWFHPRDPNLKLDPDINPEGLQNDILGLYNAYRRGVRFRPEDLDLKEFSAEPSITSTNPDPASAEIDWTAIGSNNWVLNGDLTQSGKTLMANDPHRTIAVPSLRYMAHLVAPGWNVIGGGEPEIPGISIGHNEYGTWGLTVFETDGEDLYVYKLNPKNLNQYEYEGQWEDMTVITETINVKGSEDVAVDMRYTRHGPVTFIDTARATGYAVRCAWLEPGGSPYLASLRMDQAKTWEEFREACNYSHIPGENMVWADVDGNIGWQAVGIAPIRRNFSGLVPVPGDGRYEWDGYLPIIEKPNIYNPSEGFFATANENVTPDSYDQWNAIAYSWSDPYRGNRIREVLSSGEKFTMAEMQALQTDYVSLPARALVPMLGKITFDDLRVRTAKERINNWDFDLTPESVEAGIYIAWENEIRKSAKNLFVPEEVKSYLTPQLTRILSWLDHPEHMFGNTKNRDEFLQSTFRSAIRNLSVRFGDDPANWVYGKPEYKHVYIAHALSAAVNDSLKNILDQGPFPRGGNSYTPGSTGSSNNQSSGASFRMIVETGNWDEVQGTNAPGQSGDPASRYYDNLFEMWAADQYFPVYYSRQKIEEVAQEKYMMVPVR